LKDAAFASILTLSSQHFLNLQPENCKPGKKGFLYPKMQYFARALLVTQNRPELIDIIDSMGMDLDEAWGG